jgi:hypothetical protein
MINFHIIVGKCVDNGINEAFVVVYEGAHPDHWDTEYEIMTSGVATSVPDAMTNALVEMRRRDGARRWW